MTPLVSIITPCYNGEQFLDIYFASVLSQTWDNLELIFVNDGSTDRTEQIALAYRPILEARGIVYKYVCQPHGGQAKAMNAGLKEMTGKYLVWPDSDDWLEPDSIEKRVIFLEEHPDFQFVRSNGDMFDFDTEEKIGSIDYFGGADKEDIFMDLIQETTYCACGCYMIRTDLLKTIYPDLTIYETNVGQNWQLLIPVAGRGKCGYIDEVQYHIAVRSNSHSRSCRSLEEEVARRLELKKVLLIGIEKSLRNDCDYRTIVEQKYLHILFKLYMEAAAYGEARNCYVKIDTVREDEYRQYAQVWHPVRYKLYCACSFVQRICRKIKRIIIK